MRDGRGNAGLDPRTTLEFANGKKSLRMRQTIRGHFEQIARIVVGDSSRQSRRSIHQALRQKCLRLRVAGIGGVHQLLLLECGTPAAAITRQQPTTRPIPLIGGTRNPSLNLFFVYRLLARGDHRFVIGIFFLYRSSYPFGVLHRQRSRVQQLLRLRGTTLAVDTRESTGAVRHILQNIGCRRIPALRLLFEFLDDVENVAVRESVHHLLAGAESSQERKSPSPKIARHDRRRRPRPWIGRRDRLSRGVRQLNLRLGFGYFCAISAGNRVTAVPGQRHPNAHGNHQQNDSDQAQPFAHRSSLAQQEKARSLYAFSIESQGESSWPNAPRPYAYSVIP